MNNIKNATAIVSIVALFLGVAAPSVQAAPSAEMCRTLPKSEPWKNHPTHVWNVVWRNKVALCTLQVKLDQLQSGKVQVSPTQVNQPDNLVAPIALDNNQPLPQKP